MLSPENLDLVRYFFPVQSVSANPNYDAESEMGGQYSLSTDFNHSRDPDTNINRITVVISVETDDDCEGCDNDPYIFELAVVGYFEYQTPTTDTPSKEQDSKHIRDAYILGCQVLFGALRERLTDLTGRGPWDPIYINTFHASDFAKTLKKKPADT